MLDAERAQRLSRGTNHQGEGEAAATKKKDKKDKKSKKSEGMMWAYVWALEIQVEWGGEGTRMDRVTFPHSQWGGGQGYVRG